MEVPFPDDVVLSSRRVQVKGLLPASRYRLRYRSTDPATSAWIPWKLASFSDWFITAGEARARPPPPSPAGLLHLSRTSHQALPLRPCPLTPGPAAPCPEAATAVFPN